MTESIGPVTPQQLMAHFEETVNTMKANKVTPARDVDGRSGYGVCVDHIVFCAMLRDERIFMELSQSIIQVRGEDGSIAFRTALYYGPLGLFVFVP